MASLSLPSSTSLSAIKNDANNRRRRKIALRSVFALFYLIVIAGFICYKVLLSRFDTGTSKSTISAGSDAVVTSYSKNNAKALLLEFTATKQTRAKNQRNASSLSSLSSSSTTKTKNKIAARKTESTNATKWLKRKIPRQPKFKESMTNAKSAGITVPTQATAPAKRSDNNEKKCRNGNRLEQISKTTTYKQSTTLPQWMKSEFAFNVESEDFFRDKIKYPFVIFEFTFSTFCCCCCCCCCVSFCEIRSLCCFGTHTDYFDWHREQTRTLEECNYDERKFLILRCSFRERKCGGVADRLKSLPFYIAAAASSNRIFMIRWERPTKLEEFLRPNELNWSAPRWIVEKIDSGDSAYNKKNSIVVSDFILGEAMSRWIHWTQYKSIPILEGLLQDYFGGSSFYYRMHCKLDGYRTCNKADMEATITNERDHAGWSMYETIFHDLFFALFAPSPPIERLVRDTMESANLLTTATTTASSSKNFTACHYRAYYGVENKKQTVDETELIAKTRNALNCASQKRPGQAIYFASDSLVAVDTARNIATTKNRSIGTFANDREALHLDKRYQWRSGNVADFYSTFVDLLIMSRANCISYGLGGFGRFASLISNADPSCAIRHDDHRRPKKKKKTQPNNDDDDDDDDDDDNGNCKWHDRDGTIEDS